MGSIAVLLDQTEDGQEISIIRREQEVMFLDWYDSLPERWEKAWAIAIEFVKKWNPDVR